MRQHKIIYLQPLCDDCDDPGEERSWCEDYPWDAECPNCGRNIERPVYILKEEGKTVIGTCGDCRHWEDPDYLEDKVDDEYGVCQESDHIEISDLETRKHFGCIHWKEKGKS